jgi:hypothetical protein
MSRPAARAAVPSPAWHTISSTVTAALRRNRVNRISCDRRPASRRIQQHGRSTRAAWKATPLFPGDGRQTAPARSPWLLLRCESTILKRNQPPKISATEMCAYDSRARGEVGSHRRCDPGEGDLPRVRMLGESPSPPPSPRKNGERERIEFTSPPATPRPTAPRAGRASLPAIPRLARNPPAGRISPASPSRRCGSLGRVRRRPCRH